MSTTIVAINSNNNTITSPSLLYTEEANPHSDASRNNSSNNVTLSHSVSISGVADFYGQDDTTTDDVVKPALIDQSAARNRAPPSPYASSFENVASSGKGARVLFATDEWFAAADNLIHDSDPFYDPDEYCEQGKVMDGWESRRRREAGHDWCVIELSGRARLVAVEIDTAHFTGNHAPAISLELADLSSQQGTAMASQFPGIVERLLHGCVRGTSMTPPQVHEAEAACRGVEWVEILSKTPLRPGVEATRMHYFALPAGSEGTHLRLNYFPDGGVARLRLWGNVVGDRPRPTPGPAYSPQVTGEVCTVVPHSSSTTAPPPSQRPYPHPELSLESRGGRELLCSNKHYGRPLNLIQPTLGKDMGDGWETARHPSRPSILVKDAVTNLVDSPLVDWCVIKLGSVAASGVSRIILDTKHFRGNYPESVQVQGCYLDTATEDEDQERALLSDVDSDLWFPLVKRCRMSPDSEHVFDADSNQIASANRPVSHVKVSIYPDGGLSRVRVYGAV